MSKFYTSVAVVGSSVYVREIVDGIPNMRKDSWSPTVYVNGAKEGSEYKSLYGHDVHPVQPGSIAECKEFIEQYEDVQGFPIYGQLNFSLQYMHEYNPTGWLYSEISAWGIDIETKVPLDENGNTYFPTPENADGEILLITLQDLHTKVTYTWGTKPYDGRDTQYMYCVDEYNLIKQFILFWEQKKPDIITGWNIGQFDIPYLFNRIKRICGEEMAKRLSPWGRVYYKSKLFAGKLEHYTQITGVSVLDYLDLYKKYILTRQESYSLKHIAFVELGHTKVDHSEYATFNDFWQQDWNKFTHYNVVDTTLVGQLDDKLKLIELVLTMAYEAHINYEDVSSPVKLWDAIINNYALDRKIVLPQQEREKSLPLDGAYVKEPIPGWYHNVVSLDATSLYPSIIMTNNISPETWRGNCGMNIDDFLANKPVEVEEKYIVTAAGAVYDKSIRGILPELVEYYMKMRKAAKTEMLRLEQEYENTHDEKLPNQIAAYDAKQMAFKVALNSLYGATANEYFRFFKHDHAASITLSGQYVLRTVEENIDAALSKAFNMPDGTKFLIYIDTDSLYFSLDSVFKKYNIAGDKAIKAIEKLAKEKITPIVNKFCQECCDKMRSYENRLNFKLEIAADKAIWLGKKKYALRAHSSEGVTFAKPKFKVKGLEMVRSSTPQFVRDKLKDALDIVFDKTEKETQRYIEQVRQEFMKLPYEQVSFPRGANNLAEYSDWNTVYKKGKGESTPIQVRASLLYNRWLKHYKLDGTYPLIGEGEKIKFVYLKLPNRIRENVIAFPADGKIPAEFGIIDKIDYDLQFEKTFLASMEIILSAIKWNAVETSSLEDFFA